jgi:hypothetical protein
MISYTRSGVALMSMLAEPLVADVISRLDPEKVPGARHAPQFVLAAIAELDT